MTEDTLGPVTAPMITTMHRGLTDFGYELRRRDVIASVARMMAGREPECIIDSWVRGWLRDAMILPEEMPDAP